MDEDIKDISKFCTSCHIHQNMTLKAFWGKSRKPCGRIHLDFAGPYLGKVFPIITNSYSKWIDIIPMNSINSGTLTQCLTELFSTDRLPFIIVTDNGPSLTSNELNLFNEKNGIKHILTAPYHPSSNEMAECSVQTFKNAIKQN